MVQHFADNKWSEPIPLTSSGGDLHRPSIALDGKGRPWVFWSDNRDKKGVYELRARVLEKGTPQT
jgi:beta-xylosidase